MLEPRPRDVRAEVQGCQSRGPVMYVIFFFRGAFRSPNITSLFLTLQKLSRCSIFVQKAAKSSSWRDVTS